MLKTKDAQDLYNKYRFSELKHPKKSYGTNFKVIMNVEQFRDYCLTKKGVTEHFPFDEVTLVFKVMNKVFALSSLNNWEQGEPKVNLKCNPERALELRAAYGSVTPGWHMNKKHWNTIILNNDVSDEFAFELINHSYELVIKGFTKKIREELRNL